MIPTPTKLQDRYAALEETLLSKAEDAARSAARFERETPPLTGRELAEAGWRLCADLLRGAHAAAEAWDCERRREEAERDNEIPR